MGMLSLDVRHAWRSAVGRPGATTGRVLVQAVGIGLVAAVFGLADPFLLRPLPYFESNQLIAAQGTPRDREGSAAAGSLLTPGAAAWAQRTDLFQHAGAYRRRGTIRVRLPGGAAILNVAEATQSFFDTLGVPGPGWATAQHMATAGVTPLVITQSAFRRAFGSRREAIGRTFPTDDGGTIRLVGVLPEDFLFPSDFLLRRSNALTPATKDLPMSGTTVIARLRPGITSTRVQTALSAASPALLVTVQSLRGYLGHYARHLALVALVTGGVIFLICAANLGSLFVARSFFRASELRTRRALGASPVDLLRLIIVEVALGTAAAFACGLLLSAIILGLARRVRPFEFGVLGDPAVTGRVVACAVLAALVLLTVEFSSAWGTCRWILASGAGHRPAGRGVRTVRFALVAAQSALVMALVSGAAFLVRSYVDLMRQDTGFTGDVLAVKASYPSARAGSALQTDIERTLESMRRIIGVHAVAASQGPLVDHVVSRGLTVVGGKVVTAVIEHVTPGYFETVGTPLVEGRTLAVGDDKARAIVVNQALARRDFPTARSPVGRLVGADSQVAIVGLVGNSFTTALDEPPEPTIYTPLHDPPPCHGADCNTITYLLRLADGAPEITIAARRAIVQANRDAVVEDASRLGDRLRYSIADRTFAALILALFATAGIVIGAGGLVAMVAFVVAQRTRELAIRVALGAQRSHVLLVVAGETGLAAVLGVALGLLVSAVGSKMLEHLLYGVRPGDWSTLVGAAALMVSASVIATLTPARRALRVQPAISLRTE
jgi:putative ABC transport system permease protein